MSKTNQSVRRIAQGAVIAALYVVLTIIFAPISFGAVQVRIAEIMTIFNNYGFNTQVIAASIRGPMHVAAAAQIGCDIATIPYDVLKKMIEHPKTSEGIAKFIADYEKSQKN